MHVVATAAASVRDRLETTFYTYLEPTPTKESLTGVSARTAKLTLWEYSAIGLT